MDREIRQRTRDRRLTKQEAARYQRIREQVAEEMPHILERARAARVVRNILAELRAAREAMGLSLADIHEQTGMDRSAVSRLENGQRENPTVETLARYADAVGKRIVITLIDAEEK
jgi:predicted transcriptional regulator